MPYSYRAYCPGDEDSINALYAQVTGRKRSREDFTWQWLDAPGGRGEIWLVESDFRDAPKRLIGHHGVMPIRFSHGSEDLLFGKTENTLLHPDFRGKILYPRFESRFRENYESRFHALFSTMGPAAAIRQRRIQGYEFPAVWKKFIWAVRPLGNFFYLGSQLTTKMDLNGYGSIFANRFKGLSGQTFHVSQVKIQVYNDQDAKKVGLLRSYWNNVRHRYHITPSRDHEDLKWRFWNNPHISYWTLILDSVSLGTGFAVLSMLKPGIVKIEDFVVERPRSKSFGYLLNALLKWISKQGAYCVEFTTTDDSIQWVGIENFNLASKNVYFRKSIEKIAKIPQHRMPRKICNSGRELNLKNSDWYITPIVSQGVR